MTQHTDPPPPLPDPCRVGDGYEWIDALTDGWRPVAAWGREGWDLGAWPVVIVAHHDGRRLYSVGTYAEGDLDVQAFPTRAERDATTDHIAATWWRTFNNGPADLPATDTDLADHYRGLYRPKREPTTGYDQPAQSTDAAQAREPELATRLTPHRWIAADEDDRCLRCGLTIPAAGADTLPSACPGSDIARAHVLALGPNGTLECGYCTLAITETTTYQQIPWECPGT
jgi:hypothetical protein